MKTYNIRVNWLDLMHEINFTETKDAQETDNIIEDLYGIRFLSFDNSLMQITNEEKFSCFLLSNSIHIISLEEIKDGKEI